MILAIKTADFTTALTLLDVHGKTVQAAHWESARRLADQLLEKIEQLLSDAKAVPPDLNGIIIFSGPGSFTSLRIGHSVANALADSLEIPIVGTSGDEWVQQGQEALKHAQPGRPTLPVYGADAHITMPKA